MNLKCDTCGDLDYVIVNGYWFGDRLLEDVMFKVEDDDDEPNTIGVTDDSVDYFLAFDSKKWFDECDNYCKWEDTGCCPHCGSDVDIWGINKHRTSKAIPMISGNDFLEKKIK